MFLHCLVKWNNSISFINILNVGGQPSKPIIVWLETALIKIFDDLLLNLDNKKVVLLSLLDLSAAFDTVDHNILLNRLKHMFGITDVALDWFTSYLSDRSQKVSIAGAYSVSRFLECCVPQGSVLGPQLYSQYTRPIGDII